MGSRESRETYAELRPNMSPALVKVLQAMYPCAQGEEP